MNPQSPQSAETSNQQPADPFHSASDSVANVPTAATRGGPADRPPSIRPSFTGPTRIRLVAVLAAAIPLSALCLARNLQPSSSGLGTHQQLGLPPCSMRLMFGIRCPGCGMTTSWAHFTRGDWRASITTSVGGFLFALFAIWIAFLGTRTALTAQAPGPGIQIAIASTAAGIFAVALLQWAYRLLG